ncbi:SusC/RagA family TonB-linked outer membrane protein [Parapedobacter pyrenivorans]|uniref:SusC/RagA family TonB-linked outer membrane protein n=1 Tax=Parapedobacter pyrenivorans TaxID=1305674 RepID=UPI00333FD6ED
MKKRNKKPVIHLFLALLSTALSFTALAQQELTVSGTITDSVTDEALEGVTVEVSGGTTSVQTNKSGGFLIRVSIPATLIFTSVGYTQARLEVNSDQTLAIKLVPSAQDLEEVVVVGYGTQKKTSVTAAVSSMKGEDIASVPVTNLSNGLGGRIPGVIFRQGSGEPGRDGSSIYIRGISTTGSSQPLLVVDGIPRSYQNLDPNAIESISVLKDAAAVAPYGMAGANGVILVTTKRGADGKPALTYRNSIGIQNPTVLPEYVNAYEYAILRNEASKNEGNPPRFSDLELQKYRDGSNPDVYANSNALEEIVRHNTLLTTHNLELSGSTDRIRFYTGVGYQYQAGIWGPTHQDRFNLNLNVDVEATETTNVAISITGRRQKNNYPSTGSARLFELTKYVLPINPIRYTNGLNAHFPYGSIYNSGYSNEKTLELFSQISIEQELPFIPGLSIKGQIAYDPTTTQSKTWVTPVHVWSIDTTTTPYSYIDGIFGQDKPSLNQSVGQIGQLTYQASLNYGTNFGKNSIALLGVFEARTSAVSNIGGARTNYNIYIDELNMGSSSNTDITNSGFTTEAKQVGWVYRLTYDYDNKYLLEAAGRYDGHYYFAPDKRFGFFPSFSAGWRISEENFVKDNVSWLNNLKIRGSYGEVGALAGLPFQYLSSYAVFGPAYAFDGRGVQGVRERSEANVNITWERARKTNIGLEATLWQGLLSFEGDYFFEKRSNMLAIPNVMVPMEYGVGLSQENAAVMENSGVDLAVSSNFSFENGMSVSLTGNVTYARNKLIEVFETAATYDNPNRRLTGRALGSQFGYRSLGYFKADDFEVDGSLKSDIAVQPWGSIQPGDIRYQDQNGDLKINEDDLTWIGNPQVPQIVYGLGPSLRFRNFSLDLLFQGATRTSFLGSGMYDWAFFNNTNVLRDNLNYWTPDNQDARYPRITNAMTPNNSQVSSFWMRDASYLRLKSGVIAYNLPSAFCQSIHLRQAKVFLAGQNILTWTKIRNYDPETVDSQGNNYPQQRVFSFGMDLTF